MEQYENEDLDNLIQEYLSEIRRLPIGSEERRKAVESLCRLKATRSQEKAQADERRDKEDANFVAQEEKEKNEIRERAERKTKKRLDIISTAVKCGTDILAVVLPFLATIWFGKACIRFESDGHIPSGFMKTLMSKLTPDGKKIRG